MERVAELHHHPVEVERRNLPRLVVPAAGGESCLLEVAENEKDGVDLSCGHRTRSGASAISCRHVERELSRRSDPRRVFKLTRSARRALTREGSPPPDGHSRRSKGAWAAPAWHARRPVVHVSANDPGGRPIRVATPGGTSPREEAAPDCGPDIRIRAATMHSGVLTLRI